jgi:uncharacterized protein involved in outer membrane biogenesis
MKFVKVLGFTVAGVLGVAAVAGAAAVWYLQSADLRPLVMHVAKSKNLPIELAGPVRARILSGPELQLAGLKVASLQGEGTLASVDRAKVRLAWGGGLFFWHNMQLKEVIAENPTLNLVRSKNGVANWQMPQSAEAAPAEIKTTTGATPMESLNTALGMLASARMDVTNLNLTYNDAMTGRMVKVQNMNVAAAVEGSKATTTLSGTINASPLAGDVTVDVANVRDIPMSMNLKAAGLTAAVGGRLTNQNHFAGKVDVQTANLKQTLVTLLGKAPEQAPAAEFRLVGDASGGAEGVALHNFMTRMGDLLQAHGDLTAKLGDKPSANGTFHAEGSNLRSLAELVQGAAQPKVPALPFALDAELSGQNTLTLKSGKFMLGTVLTATATADVTPGATAMIPTVNAKVGLSIPSMQALGKALNPAQTLPAKPLDVELALQGKDGAYRVTEATATLDDLLKAQGAVQFSFTKAGLQNVSGNINVSGNNVKETASGFGVVAAGVPESPFKASASFAGKDTIDLNDVVIDLPQLVEATAKLSVSPGKPLSISGAVNVTRLNATALGYCKVEQTAQAAPTVENAPATSAADAPWSDDPINLSALQSVAVNLNLDVRGISCAKAPVQTVKGHIVNTPSQLDVKDFALTTAGGGSASLTMKLEHAGTPNMTMQMTAANFPVEEFVPTLKAKGMRLPLDMRAMLDSQGASTRVLAQNLGGTVTMNSTKGQLPYTDMLGNVMNLQKLIAGGTLPTNGNGAVDSLKGAFTLKNGVMSTDVMEVVTGGNALTLTGTGTVDIAGWAINYTLTPTLHVSSDLAIPVLIKGPLTKPSIGADPAFVSKISSRLATQAVGKALGLDKAGAQGVGSVVGDLLGGKGVSATSVGNMLDNFTKKGSSGTSGTHPKTDAVKGILNGILAK